MVFNDELNNNFDENLEEFEKRLFERYRNDLREYIKKENVDDVYSLTDGSLLASLVLIRTYNSQEKLNRLTKILIVLTTVLVFLTIVLGIFTVFLYLKG
jgi:hypothetical protein